MGLKVGFLTGGGDAPGLNAVIRGAIFRLAKEQGAPYEPVGLKDGWAGMRDGVTTPLNLEMVDGILHEGGTIIGTSRTNLYKKGKTDAEKAVASFKSLGLHALIAIGGDDTLEIATYLHRDHGLNIVGVPKTIDNDVKGTDFTFGFWSSVEQATRCIDDLRVTTKSHHRVMVVECMGRHAGWITAYTGLASEADFIAAPERPVHIDEICNAVKRSRARGKQHNIVVVAEGASIQGLDAKPSVAKNEKGEWVISNKVEKDGFGNTVLKAGQVGDAVAEAIESKLKAQGVTAECRAMALGHLQRGGSPCAYDRILGTKYGVKAAEAVIRKDFGHMVVAQGDNVSTAPLAGIVRANQDVHKEYKLLPESFLDLAAIFYG